MRLVATSACCAALFLASCSSPPANQKMETVTKADLEKGEGKEVELDVLDIVGEATVSLSQALAAALASKPGVAIEVELEGEIEDGKRSVAFEAAIVGQDGVVYSVTVDPVTGSVSEVEVEDDAKELKEIQEKHDGMSVACIPLADLLAAAANATDGTPVKATYRGTKDPGRASVKFVKGRSTTTVTLDGTSGLVVPSK